MLHADSVHEAIRLAQHVNDEVVAKVLVVE